MSGVDVDFGSHAYTDEINFLGAEALNGCTQQGTVIGQLKGVAVDQASASTDNLGCCGLLCRRGSPPADDVQGTISDAQVARAEVNEDGASSYILSPVGLSCLRQKVCYSEPISPARKHQGFCMYMVCGEKQGEGSTDEIGIRRRQHNYTGL